LSAESAHLWRCAYTFRGKRAVNTILMGQGVYCGKSGASGMSRTDAVAGQVSWIWLFHDLIQPEYSHSMVMSQLNLLVKRFNLKTSFGRLEHIGSSGASESKGGTLWARGRFHCRILVPPATYMISLSPFSRCQHRSNRGYDIAPSDHRGDENVQEMATLGLFHVDFWGLLSLGPCLGASAATKPGIPHATHLVLWEASRRWIFRK
jgi:hypothetical protein